MANTIKFEKDERLSRLNINRAKDKLESLFSLSDPTEETVATIESHVTMLKDDFDILRTAVTELCYVLDPSKSEDQKKEDGYLKSLDKAKEILALFQGKVVALRNKVLPPLPATIQTIFPSGNLNADISEYSSLRLPKIDLPKLDGDLTQVLNFKNMFEKLVHSHPRLSKAEKMCYLKQSLINEAEIILRDFQVQDESYDEAWAYFCERFANPRAVIEAHFRNLMNLPVIKGESGIRSLLDKVNVTIRGLKVCGEIIDETFSRFLCFLVVSKLDNTTSRDWKNSLDSVNEFPSYSSLEKFLQNRSFACDDIKQPERDTGNKISSKKKTDKKSFSVSIDGNCLLCSGEHSLHKCEEFGKKTPKQRYYFLKKQGGCLICFSTDGHSVESCPSKTFSCKVCGLKHNTLLHFADSNKGNATEKSKSSDFVKSSDKPVAGENSVKTNNSASASTTCFVSQKTVFLPTAVTNFRSGLKTGKSRTLLDSCSQATLASDLFVRKYNLITKRTDSSAPVRGIGGISFPINETVSLTLVSRAEPFFIDIIADVVPASAIRYTTNSRLTATQLNALRGFRLADPEFASVSDVDILIGAEYYGKCRCNESRVIENLDIRLSRFGWTVAGASTATLVQSSFSGLTMHEIERNLQQFWEIEEVGVTNAPSNEQSACLKHFEDNVRIADDGKFVVKLPFKVDRNNVDNNYENALRSLKRLEFKLGRNAKIKAAYVEFMNEYIQLNHMSRASSITGPKYYIPHRAVIREESTTTPLRVVFNASSCKKGAVSLDDALMVGPTVQRDLFDILLSMRGYKYVLTSDVEKMYRMVWIDEADRTMQRILWRSDPSEPIQEYVLNTVTYGVAPASFLATQCLIEIAKETSNPLVANFIRDNFYMDDLTLGSDSEDELIQLQSQVHGSLIRHGFLLRKYCSNSEKLMHSISDELCVPQSKLLQSGVSILGLNWKPDEDTLHIKPQESFAAEIHSSVTKRKILSIVSRAFDPLGLISPVILCGKLIIQELWREGKSWDEPVSPELAILFGQYLSNLENLQGFAFPRTVLCLPKYQLVLFCDASAKAYSAAVYARCISNSVVHSRLICAKNRVAPIKSLTIPRLELQSALLGTQLVSRVALTLNIPIENVYAFSNSTIVLCWLSKPTSAWKTYVANRTQKICSVIPFNRWSYVPTSENPADLATRGLDIDEYQRKIELWLNGPKFLTRPDAFTFHAVPNIDTHAALERRKEKLCSMNVVVHENFLTKFSSLPKLVRVIAYILRFIDHSRGIRRPDTHVISNAEYQRVLNVGIKLMQGMDFAAELQRIKDNRPLKKGGRLSALDPQLDEDGLLRVGGRIHKALVSDDKKHPIILLAKSHLTILFCRYLHDRYFHADRSLLATLLIGRFWVVGGRTNLLKKIVRECITCTRMKGRIMEQKMGILPEARLTVSRPFTYSGVDLAGPFDCKCLGHRSQKINKIYLALFVCFATRAVHLEIVSDLTAEMFIMCLQRFLARRGPIVVLQSDNATNFQHAHKFLLSIQDELVKYATKESFDWSFIPPRSPNFGGIWESGIKSAKKHILTVTRGATLTFEEYATLFTRVESILNSRPLCYTKHLAQEFEVLTPAHFLYGGGRSTLIDQPNVPLSQRFNDQQTRLRSFYHAWSRDYLNQLQCRGKWTTERPNLMEGEVVLVKEKGKISFDWPIARVVKTYPGPDGLVRVADVKFKDKVYKRGLDQIIRLPDDSADIPVSPGEDVHVILSTPFDSTPTVKGVK